MSYYYLFINPKNAPCQTRFPFVSNKELTEELSDKFILQYNPAAERIGSTFYDLMEGAAKHGYQIIPLEKIPYPFPTDATPLKIIFGISGSL